MGYQHIINNRVNHVGPSFPTFYTRNTETKPDVVLTNNNFYLNQNVTSGGIGPSDHITINITVSAEPIIAQCTPHPDIKNTNWDVYKNILSTEEEINLEGNNVVSILQEFDK